MTSNDPTYAAPRRRWTRRAGNLVRDVVEAVVLAVALFVALQFVVQNTVVEGSSMAPNFVDREHLLVNKVAYRLGAPARGDVVVFHAPEGPRKDFIKRVIGLPHETVELRSGTVFIDGQVLDEPWAPYRDDSTYGPYVVPPEHVFVLGDNRPNSNDSRVFGGQFAGAGPDAEPAIAMEQVVGKVWLSVWPVEVWGRVRADAPGPARQAPVP